MGALVRMGSVYARTNQCCAYISARAERRPSVGAIEWTDVHRVRKFNLLNHAAKRVDMAAQRVVLCIVLAEQSR